MIGLNYIILLASVAYSCKAAVLPTYVDRCCMDNSLNDCITKRLNRVFKTFTLGDDHYNFYNYFPLRLPKVKVLNNAQGNFTVTNIRVYGFPLAQVISANYNFIAGTYHAQYALDKLSVDCDYDIWLNNTCVTGFGSAEIIMRNISLNHSFLIQMDNEGYPRIRNATATYSTQSTQYSMSNMDAAGNAYMNMNAVALGMLFKSQVSEAFSDILSLPYIAVGDKVKITDVINFSCPMNTTTTTTPSSTTCPPSSTLNLWTILTG